MRATIPSASCGIQKYVYSPGVSNVCVNVLPASIRPESHGWAPFGTYHLTNPGFVTTRRVIGLIERILKPGRRFEFWKDDEEFYRLAAKTPRSNCVLDASKLLATGVQLRPVEEALEDSLKNWKPEKLSTINSQP